MLPINYVCAYDHTTLDIPVHSHVITQTVSGQPSIQMVWDEATLFSFHSRDGTNIIL